MLETSSTDSGSSNTIGIASPAIMDVWIEPVAALAPRQHTLAEVRVAEGILPAALDEDPAVPCIRVLADGLAPQVLLRKGDTDTVLPALWLRARSPDPSQRDKVTG